MTSVRDIAPPWLRFITAAEWGIRWKRPPVDERQQDPETFIHHTAGTRWHTDPAEAMRRLQAWYHDTKNYSTIAYDIMVHRNTDDDTVTVCGAREGKLSAATKDRNDIGEAICLWGTFHPGYSRSERPHPRELEALAFAFAWSIEEGWSAPDSKLMGHRDNPAHPGATTCPGDYLYPAIGDIARRARQLLALAAEQDRPPPPPPSVELALLTRVQQGDGWWAIARRCYGTASTPLAERLQQANPTVGTLKPGQLVNVPGRAVV